MAITIRNPLISNLRRFYVRFDGLRDWTWTSGIHVKYEQPAKAIYTYQVPDDVPLGHVDGLSGKLEFSGTTSPGAGSLSIREDCQLIIEAEELTPYEAFQNVFYTFQHFLSLALQRPSYAVRVIGNIETPREVIEGHEFFEDFLIIRKLSNSEWDQETLIPQHMLFTLPELEESFEKTIGCFFSKRERLKPAMDLYMSTVYHPDQLLRAKFLTLAQSIEGYHRVSLPGKYVGDKTYENGLRRILWDAIPSGTDSGFRESLKNKFKYLHEFSLRKRIAALAQNYTSIIGKFLGPPEEFASSISELRNQLTHPDPSNTSGELDYKRLFNLCEAVALLLEVCFLDELGFSHNRIREIVGSRSERARRVYYGTF